MYSGSFLWQKAAGLTGDDHRPHQSTVCYATSCFDGTIANACMLVLPSIGHERIRYPEVALRSLRKKGQPPTRLAFYEGALPCSPTSLSNAVRRSASIQYPELRIVSSSGLTSWIMR